METQPKATSAQSLLEDQEQEHQQKLETSGLNADLLKEQRKRQYLELQQEFGAGKRHVALLNSEGSDGNDESSVSPMKQKRIEKVQDKQERMEYQSAKSGNSASSKINRSTNGRFSGSTVIGD